jgi:ubiquitin carboxyl-terminal hydrolase 4/11/15
MEDRKVSKALTRRILAVEEMSTIANIFKSATIEPGDSCFVLSSKWYQLWVDYVEFYYNNQKLENVDDTELMPPSAIDNNDLINDSADAADVGIAQLKSNLAEGIDYIILPEAAWNTLVIWYGGGPILKRQAFAKKKTMVRQPSAAFLQRIAETSKSELKGLSHLTAQIQVDMYPFLFYVADFNEPSKVSPCFASRFYTLDELKSIICKQLYGQEHNCSLLIQSSDRAEQDVRISGKQSNVMIDNIEGLVSNCTILVHRVEGDVTQTKASQDELNTSNMEIKEGLVGMENLGNTCYLNSALQCLGQLKIFSDYFIEGRHLAEIRNHPDRELSLINEFSNYVKLVWYSDTGTIIVPRLIRAAISNVDQQFAGISQHDAQELLSLVIDSLHEDLNRVTVKPYSENPDWKGESDEDFSKIFWENHLKRNSSIIVNLFHGQLKSLIECTTCRHKSINFDAFLFLTVPIPSMTFRIITVTVVHLNDGLPLVCPVRVPTEGTVNELISAWKASNAQKYRKRDYIVVDVQGHYVFNMLKRYKKLSDIRDRDTIYLYEYKAAQVMQRVDSEINIKNLGAVGRQIYGAYTRIHFVHRKYKDEWWRGKTNKPSLFSHPLVCIVNDPADKPMAAVEIYKLVARRLESIYNLNLFNIKEADAKTLISIDSSESSNAFIPYPFIIKLTSRNGKECRQCDDKECTGCILLYSDATINLGWDDTFALDWSSQQTKTKEVFKADIFSTLEKNIKMERDKSEDSKSSVSLHHCLEKFQMPEHLSSEMWYCSKCKEHKASTKTITIYRSPVILIIHINRFKQEHWNLIKNSTLIEYPLELDLAKYVSAVNEDPVLYDLVGVINHSGDIHSGHYTSFCKNAVNGKWFLFDDSEVFTVQNNDVVHDAGYILFYKRKDAESIYPIACKEFL